jgi:DNA-binding CsgD family transcriptional regulator
MTRLAYTACTPGNWTHTSTRSTVTPAWPTGAFAKPRSWLRRRPGGSRSSPTERSSPLGLRNPWSLRNSRPWLSSAHASYLGMRRSKPRGTLYWPLWKRSARPATAYRVFRQHGYLWRATLALIELDATPAPASRREFHQEAAALLVRQHFPHSFLARRLGRWGRVYSDPVAAKLTPTQRQVLRYVLDGFSAKEIASATGRSEGRVKNIIADLHTAFDVGSTGRLIAACHRRGIGSPAWSEREASPAQRIVG